MTRNRPRLVVVTRKTPLDLLLERHGTYGQARFYLESRGQSIASAEETHARFQAGLARVQAAFPADERRVQLDRADLATFLFAPDDVLIVVGQDGLVPNVAKYLSGQLMLGINPDPERNDGILCPHAPQAVPRLLEWLETRSGPDFRVQERTMAVVEREDGQRLLALNEVFVGHRTHQSARYRLRVGGREERQSSSGLICATGTGSTGWARSIVHQRHLELAIAPEEPRLAWFVREPFPSISTAADLDFGLLGPDESLEVLSEMGEDGVIFGDGIEADRLDFVTGQRARLGLAQQRLNLLVPVPRSAAIVKG
jgi:NAD kinase